MSTLWRPLLHDEWFQYSYPDSWGRDVVAWGYAVDMKMILPGHEDCQCYWSSHTKRVTWFREAGDGMFPEHCTIMDQWFTDLKQNGLAQSTLNGMWLDEVCGCGISYGSLRKLPRSWTLSLHIVTHCPGSFRWIRASTWDSVFDAASLGIASWLHVLRETAPGSSDMRWPPPFACVCVLVLVASDMRWRPPLMFAACYFAPCPRYLRTSSVSWESVLAGAACLTTAVIKYVEIQAYINRQNIMIKWS